MKMPWRNLTGISKAIAILASIALICFGLCSANLVFITSAENSKLSRALGTLSSATGATVVLCLIGIFILAVFSVIRATVRAFTDSDRPPTDTQGKP